MNDRKALEHLKLVGSLTDKPSCTSYPSEGSHGREGQAAGLQSYTCTTNKQPTNVSGVDGDAGSIRTNKRKMEGAHRCGNLFHC